MAWGGVQGPRPAAAGRSRLYHRLGAQPLRPVPPSRPGGGGAATPPRPAPPKQGSPGVPAPRTWPLNDFTAGLSRPAASCPSSRVGVTVLRWGSQRGKMGGSELLGLDPLCIRIYPFQQWGSPTLVLTKTAWGTVECSDSQLPPS